MLKKEIKVFLPAAADSVLEGLFLCQESVTVR